MDRQAFEDTIMVVATLADSYIRTTGWGSNITQHWLYELDRRLDVWRIYVTAELAPPQAPTKQHAARKSRRKKACRN